jgi:hypothetical protein
MRHGCEDGGGDRVKATRTVSEADRRALAAAFAALPPAPSLPAEGCIATATLTRSDTPGRGTEWTVCMKDSKTLPEPYASADELLRKLTAP